MAFGRAALLSMMGVALSTLTSVSGETTMTFIRQTPYIASSCAVTAPETTEYVATGFCYVSDTLGECIYPWESAGVADAVKYDKYDTARYGTFNYYETVGCDGDSMERLLPLVAEQFGGAEDDSVSFDSTANTVNFGTKSIPLGQCFSWTFLSSGESRSAIMTEVMWDGSTYPPVTTSTAPTTSTRAVTTSTTVAASTTTPTTSARAGVASGAAELLPSFLTTSVAALLSSLVGTAL